MAQALNCWFQGIPLAPCKGRRRRSARRGHAHLRGETHLSPRPPLHPGPHQDDVPGPALGRRGRGPDRGGGFSLRGVRPDPEGPVPEHRDPALAPQGAQFAFGQRRERLVRRLRERRGGARRVLVHPRQPPALLPAAQSGRILAPARGGRRRGALLRHGFVQEEVRLEVEWVGRHHRPLREGPADRGLGLAQERHGRVRPEGMAQGRHGLRALRAGGQRQADGRGAHGRSAAGRAYGHAGRRGPASHAAGLHEGQERQLTRGPEGDRPVRHPEHGPHGRQLRRLGRGGALRQLGDPARRHQEGPGGSLGRLQAGDLRAQIRQRGLLAVRPH
mmetsp:Transcript_6787/g.14516  ORF Transcript_6787/g.14516 Transcript_6787/m.14516 type:complete len:331 (-) Transcript_6787:853-1845(-)